MLGKHSSKTIPTITHNNTTITSNLEKADLFGNHFSEMSANKNLNTHFIRKKKQCERRWKNIPIETTDKNKHDEQEYYS